MQKILLLEDDVTLGETLFELLESDGFEVTWVQDGHEASEASYLGGYGLYILDVNVPLLDGFSLLRDLRAASDRTPTLFMSARVDLESIQKGFDAGAFDYIKKPFFPQELLIRVHAKISKNQKIACGSLLFDPLTKEVRIDEQVVSLGSVGVALLELFLNRKGELIEKEELYECLTHPSDGALRVALEKLKRVTKLPIKNIRSMGYLLESC